MKPFLIALLLLLGATAHAQRTPYRFSPLPLDAQSNQVVYTATQPVPGVAKAQLLARAQQWATQFSRTAKATAPRTNTEAGTLSTQITLRNGQESYSCQVTITAQEGSYHYTLSRVTYTQPSYARAGKYSPTGPVTSPIETLVYTRPSKYRDRKLAEIDTALQRLLNGLHQQMLDAEEGLAQQ